jgi:Proto-chlorophyllide reductase 57 kD subunit
MKFLCLNCDEGMKLETTKGPREGSLEAIFACPRCRYQIIMLTNPWETQLVQTLGVTIGGRATPVAPYERILDSLVRPGSEAQEAEDAEHSSAVCPFAEMFGQAEEAESAAGIQWVDAAKVRLERIPSFIRPMVQRAIERYAMEQGYHLITEVIMDEARSRLGM